MLHSLLFLQDEVSVVWTASCDVSYQEKPKDKSCFGFISLLAADIPGIFR